MAHSTSPSERVLDLDGTRLKITSYLRQFLEQKAQRALTDGLPTEVPNVLRDFVDAGGKRLRPLLCAAGWQAAGGSGLPEPVVRTAAALELYQAFALIHDDVIDRSATRRSRPAVHRALADRHAKTGADAHVGMSAAILIGNMALTWSDELVTGAGISAARRVSVCEVLDAMREEMHYGQYLDLMASLGSLADVDTSLTVIRYKTAKYTIERPLHAGAALAGAGPALRRSLTRFALPLGEAFQLRDDLLGVMGDPKATGKPVLDDLREGKRTVLLALAVQRADSTQRDVLEGLVGNQSLDEQGALRVVEVLRETQAASAVEQMINERYERSLAALEEAPVPAATADVLRAIASLAVDRES
ncbi:polyprenyl synthetase family protein [Streptomyces griseoluteus]|uniref:polyprenyl synthetase family protein n=1 Tax=Streptomyces griseoluteus TaxID=29306 RepID=UPI0036EBC4B6